MARPSTKANRGPRADAQVTAERPAKRRRLKHDQRRQIIVETAAAFFAENGFEGSTRALAREMGVTQALLYKFFPSKEALIEAVLAHTFADHWDSAWNTLLADDAIPLTERLTRFYQSYAGRFSYVSLRLMVLAGLSDFGVARRKSFTLTERVLAPVCRALRQANGLPSFDEAPMTRGERELAMALHGGIVFIGIRKHVYQMPLPDDSDALVALHVRAFVDGAAAAQRMVLHEGGNETLAVPLLKT